MRSSISARLAVALAIVFVGFGTGLTNAATLSNPSFESTVLGPGGFQWVSNGDNTTITGWTVGSSGGPPNTVYLASTFIPYTLQPTNGDQLVVLNDDGLGNISSISQTIATPDIGNIYRLTFDLSRELGTTAPVPVNVSASGNAASTYFADYDPTLAPNWVTHTYYFTIASANTTITFSRTSLGEDSSPAIDNLVLEAIPEPSSLSLLALGGAGLTMARRRRMARGAATK